MRHARRTDPVLHLRGARRPRVGLRALLVACLAACAALASVQAQQPVHDARPLAFSSAAEEDRFHALAAELRCVQCQNQSLADSNAQIAQDLRREVLDLMQQGHDDARIKQFLVQRYGEFVLYQPPLQPATWLLWAGPLVFMALGGLLVARLVRRRAALLPAAGTDPDADGDA